MARPRKDLPTPGKRSRRNSWSTHWRGGGKTYELVLGDVDESAPEVDGARIGGRLGARTPLTSPPQPCTFPTFGEPQPRSALSPFLDPGLLGLGTAGVPKGNYRIRYWFSGDTSVWEGESLSLGADEAARIVIQYMPGGNYRIRPVGGDL